MRLLKQVSEAVEDKVFEGWMMLLKVKLFNMDEFVEDKGLEGG